MVEIYAHERDEAGNIKVPEEKVEFRADDSMPATLETELRDLTVLAGMIHMSQADFESLAEQIKAKWAAKEVETPTAPSADPEGGIILGERLDG